MKRDVVIAGGGPAGLMLGYLFARAGIEVTVLEKHADFLRDFRGDTVHPSTLEVLYELGLIDEFLQRPHQEVTELAGVVNGHDIKLVDFRHLPTHCKFLVLVPQWDFLDFLATKARAFPNFDLRMQTEVVDLVEDGNAIRGVVIKTKAGREELTCDLVVAADGRKSIVREKAGLVIQDYGAPIDVLWMSVRKGADTVQRFGHIAPGKIAVTLDRGDYWQVAYVIPKDGITAIKERGLETLRNNITELAPQLNEHMNDVKDWDAVRLLTVRVDRLREWYKPGLLCIGDAAHAMSPIGGIGINLAIQDAVAAANILTKPLRAHSLNTNDLKKVQARRELPTKLTQNAQVFMQNRVMVNVLQATTSTGLPIFLRLINSWARLRRIPARLVGIGVRPEHYRSPE
ncbi:MAG TPA: FAD-dependent oxidoreductase [Longimicrobiales bacterium]|nr:FAD-dependent oxidoreductase [Longimicrobiales bacterium]